MKVCGDFGGTTKNGKPCRRSAGAGGTRETGLCNVHAEPDVDITAATAPALAEEVLPPALSELAEATFQEIAHPKKRAMLSALAVNGEVVSAARAAGISSRAHYYWTDPASPYHDAEYAQLVSVAGAIFGEFIEGVAIRRATIGWEKKNAEGAVVDYRPPSDTLLLAALNARKPDTYGRYMQMRHTGHDGGAIKSEQVVQFVVYQQAPEPADDEEYVPLALLPPGKENGR